MASASRGRNMENTTCIRNASWVVRWNSDRNGHEYLRNADVVFGGDLIQFIGRNYTGTADKEIDGSSLMVMPGLINIHSHPTNQPITRAIREDIANPALYMTSLYDRTGLWPITQGALHAGAMVAYGELLKSGVTTVVDYAAQPPDGWIDLMAQSGLRIFVAPSFRDASWSVPNESRVDYVWAPEEGLRQFDEAMALIDAAMVHPSGRLGGMVAPGQVDTCLEETFSRAVEAAQEKDITLQTHAGQTLPEFQEMTRRTGRTPIQWLDQIGALGPRTIVAHCIFVDEHSWTHWHTRHDLDLLAGSGTNVAHCPVVFARYGHRLESFGGYKRRGINVGMGTDTAPHNMLEEMREAVIMSRIATGHIDDASSTDVFNAATIGGAVALGRNDLGRLAPGAKADLVLIDLDHPSMKPGRDPLRNLIFTAAERAVKHVYIDGLQVVNNGTVLSMDCEAAADRLERAQAYAEKTVPQRDVLGRDGMEIAPPVLPFAE
jgi:cytosine/adenosine deaminase-related metal-dependent hydrolase